jgi:hypothetical protein
VIVAPRAPCCAALALIACGGSGEPSREPDSLRELERLSFVAVEPRSAPFGPDALSEAFHSIREPLLVDVHEVTRGEWRRFHAALANPAEELARVVEGWEPRTDDWPASFVTLGEAREFARARGMRLPTAGEWLYCAVGPSVRPYPWGQTDQRSIANTLELGLGRPAPVGTFEAGRTPHGIYDLLGNVAEWVDGPALDPTAPPGDERAAVFGGSFRNWPRRIAERIPGTREYLLFSQTVPPTSRADDVGFRCVAPAAEYLWTHARGWGSGASVHARLVAIGRRWGRRALPLLEALAARPQAPEAFAAMVEGARQ